MVCPTYFGNNERTPSLGLAMTCAAISLPRPSTFALPASIAACTAATSPLMSTDRKSTRLNSSHLVISYAVFCLKKKKIVDEASDRVLEIRRIRQVAPFENAAEQVDAILVGRFGQVQIESGLFVDRGQRVVHLGREGDGHGDGLAISPGIVVLILFGESMEEPLH